MSLAMKAQQMRLVHIGVALCRRQAGMAKQFLNRSQIPPIAKKMCGKGMSERVRCYMRWQIKAGSQIFNQSLHRSRA